MIVLQARRLGKASRHRAQGPFGCNWPALYRHQPRPSRRRCYDEFMDSLLQDRCPGGRRQSTPLWTFSPSCGRDSTRSNQDIGVGTEEGAHLASAPGTTGGEFDEGTM